MWCKNTLCLCLLTFQWVRYEAVVFNMAVFTGQAKKDIFLICKYKRIVRVRLGWLLVPSILRLGQEEKWVKSETQYDRTPINQLACCAFYNWNRAVAIGTGSLSLQRTTRKCFNCICSSGTGPPLAIAGWLLSRALPFAVLLLAERAFCFGSLPDAVCEGREPSAFRFGQKDRHTMSRRGWVEAPLTPL